jgi:hypothetical protein
MARLLQISVTILHATYQKTYLGGLHQLGKQDGNVKHLH